mgnify:CR=1 FL=1
MQGTHGTLCLTEIQAPRTPVRRCNPTPSAVCSYALPFMRKGQKLWPNVRCQQVMGRDSPSVVGCPGNQSLLGWPLYGTSLLMKDWKRNAPLRPFQAHPGMGPQLPRAGQHTSTEPQGYAHCLETIYRLQRVAVAVGFHWACRSWSAALCARRALLHVTRRSLHPWNPEPTVRAVRTSGTLAHR